MINYNCKAVSNFSPNRKLSIVYPHPCGKNWPLLYLFYLVNLLKCIRNNWINIKPDQVLWFQDFETGFEKFASFEVPVLETSWTGVLQ